MISNLNILQPTQLKDALALLDEQKSKLRIIAGGTDIVTGIQQGSARFKNFNSLLDINRIEELKTVSIENTKMILGAAVKFSEISSNELIQKYFPLLSKAAKSIGSLQIRNLATIGGNFVNNAPCADSVPTLLVYNSSVKIKSFNSERIIPLEDFLLKPYKTQLESNEIVTHILIPLTDENYIGDFYKLGRRRAVSISRITLAVLLKTVGRKIEDIRVASGAVTPIGKRIQSVEEYAAGKIVSEELFKELAQMLGSVILEETGLRWSSPYKLPVVQQMFFQLLMGILPNLNKTKI